MRRLEAGLGYSFAQKKLLHQALTHPSAKEAQDNQRLEFLGDAVLEFWVSDTRSKLGGLLAKPAFKRVAKVMDYTEVGGAPLLGVRGNVIKAHGSSNGHALACAIGQAVKMIRSDVVGKIEQNMVCAEGISE